MNSKRLTIIIFICLQNQLGMGIRISVRIRVIFSGIQFLDVVIKFHSDTRNFCVGFVTPSVLSQILPNLGRFGYEV